MKFLQTHLSLILTYSIIGPKRRGMVKHDQKTQVHTLHPTVPVHPTKITTKKQDVFTVYNQSIERYFNLAKKTTSIYLQSVTDLQEKIIETWKKSMDSAISLQQKFVQESKMKVEVPDTTIKIINEISEQANKAQELENKMLLASIEAIRVNIKSFNNNVISFTEVNRKLAESCGSQMVSPNIGPEVFKSTILEFKKTIECFEVEQTHKIKKEVKK